MSVTFSDILYFSISVADLHLFTSPISAVQWRGGSFSCPRYSWACKENIVLVWRLLFKIMLFWKRAYLLSQSTAFFPFPPVNYLDSNVQMGTSSIIKLWKELSVKAAGQTPAFRIWELCSGGGTGVLLWCMWLLSSYLYHIFCSCFLSCFESNNLPKLESIKVSMTELLKATFLLFLCVNIVLFKEMSLSPPMNQNKNQDNCLSCKSWV